MADQTETTKEAVSTTRIVQREDGALFTWTPEIEAKPNMRPGWQYIYKDGSKSIQLDKIPSQSLDTSQASQREKKLIEENAKLREQLAEQDPSQMQDGEEPIPPPPEEVEDLTNAGQGEGEQGENTFPTPELLGQSKLQALNKHNLAEHARTFDPDIDLDPANTSKSDLLQTVTRFQEEYKQNQGANP